ISSFAVYYSRKNNVRLSRWHLPFSHIVCPIAYKKLGLDRMPLKLQEFDFLIVKCPTSCRITHIQSLQHLKCFNLNK
ncbi:hypothetical protein TSAR_006032, partial [Trichomalopsis sarcophagae]